MNTALEKLFVPYEIAKQLKEKGFNEICLGYYTHNTGIEINKLDFRFGLQKDNVNSKISLTNKFCEGDATAPFYQQVVDWLELKGVSIWAFPVYRGENIAFYKVNMAKFYTEIDTEELFGIFKDTFNSKEDALNKAIEEALKLI